MSNYPAGVSAADPHFNPPAYGECSICGQDHSPRRTCETCYGYACTDCRVECESCEAWTCDKCAVEREEVWYCAECAKESKQ